MSENAILTEEQQQALRELIRGKNVFLTGKAGTGKSTVLMAFRKQDGTKRGISRPDRDGGPADQRRNLSPLFQFETSGGTLPGIAGAAG